MSKKSHFRGCFEKQNGKRAQTLLKYASKRFYRIDWSLDGKLSSKKFLLLTCQILELLVNTLAADEKYPVLNRNNLTTPIQMQLSQKQRSFSNFFAAFLKSRLNFKHFKEKDEPHKFCIFEVKDSRFRGCFDKQYGKASQTLLKSLSQHLQHIHWSLARKLCSKKSHLLKCCIFEIQIKF